MRGVVDILKKKNTFPGLEDAKSALEAEKIRLQTQSREQEKNLLQTTQKLNRIQEELGRAHSTSSTLQNEDKERQARLTSEIEERERAQQELHQLKKQVRASCKQSPCRNVWENNFFF